MIVVGFRLVRPSGDGILVFLIVVVVRRQDAATQWDTSHAEYNYFNNISGLATGCGCSLVEIIDNLSLCRLAFSPPHHFLPIIVGIAQ